MRKRVLPGGMVRLEIVLAADEADLVMRAIDCAREKGPSPVEPPARRPLPALRGEAGTRGRVALGSCLPRAPTDPDVRISRIRLLRLRLRCGSVDAVDDSSRRQRVALQ